MAGVVFIFVREDASEAESLAEAFDAAGYFITGNDEAALAVVIWSRRALRSDAFRASAERALRSGRAVVAGLFAPPPRHSVFDAPVIDLTAWDGVDEAALQPLFEAADDIVHPIEANVIALPSRVAYEDAEFIEALPTLRPVHDEPPSEPKLGATNPRRDFRRVGARKPHKREHAALAFLAVAILSGGAFVASVAANTVSYVQSPQSKAAQSGGVSLTSASNEAVGLEDIAPEAPAQIGHRGVEPPSAHSASYRP